MNALDTDKRLREALEHWERFLETPRDTSTAQRWIRSCEQMAREVQAALAERLVEARGEQLQQIAAQDPELLPRVEQLQSEDESLLREIKELNSEITSFRLPESEQQLESSTQALTDRALAFILRVRAQETAIVTWYQEAFNRDRGPVD